MKKTILEKLELQEMRKIFKLENVKDITGN